MQLSLAYKIGLYRAMSPTQLGLLTPGLFVMKISCALSLVLVAITAESCMAASQTCVVGTLGGECITTSACSSNGGKSTAGHCPGAADS
jgi:hypothetical protein